MHRTTTTTRRPRSRLTLAAALTAALAACALPAAAQAGTVEETAGGTLLYRAAAGESNNVSVTNPIPNAVSIRDLTGVTSRTGLCAPVSSIRVNCALGIRLSEIRLGDRNDGFAFAVPEAVIVDAGPGDDSYTATNPTLASRVDYRGGDGFDHASYSNADREVRLSNDGAANDGRRFFDQDNIRGDVEELQGSGFGDEITAAGTDQQILAFNVLDGGPGRDVLRAGGASTAVTFIVMGRTADGADKIIGASGESRLDYTRRSQPVTATLNFGGADDGEPGEFDEITGSHEVVGGGQAGDTLRAPAGSTARHTLEGNGGDDRIDGADGPDFLTGGAGVDTIAAFGGNDLIRANDGVADLVGCGLGDGDKADLDSLDGFSSCERRGPITVGDAENQVGVLRLAPKVLRVEAGETARLRLSWRHPRSWRQLRRVELRLVAEDVAVGTVTIRPRAESLTADGAVELARRASRIARKGKTARALLVLRLDRSLAGRRLGLEVEAVDIRGGRQLERNAGSIRVAG